MAKRRRHDRYYAMHAEEIAAKAKAKYDSMTLEERRELKAKYALGANPLAQGCAGCKYLNMNGIPTCDYIVITGNRRPQGSPCSAKE